MAWNDYGARNYDALLGRWMGVDAESERASEWTPYRYGFNNPILYTDPDGMFESKETAQQYAKEHGMKTGFFRDNKIVENKDGTWSIDNKTAGSSTFQDKTLANEGNNDGIFTAALVTSERSIEQSSMGPGGLLLAGTTATLSVDTPILEPTDLVPQKWVGYGAAFVIGGLMYYTVDQFIVQSKGGRQNIWPDYYPKPVWKDVDWGKSDGQLADEVSKRVGDTKRGPASDNNKAKKVFRDNRSKNGKK